MLQIVGPKGQSSMSGRGVQIFWKLLFNWTQSHWIFTTLTLGQGWMRQKVKATAFPNVGGGINDRRSRIRPCSNSYAGTQRPPPQKLTPLFPREFTGKEWSQFLGRWPLCTTVNSDISSTLSLYMTPIRARHRRRRKLRERDFEERRFE